MLIRYATGELDKVVLQAFPPLADIQDAGGLGVLTTERSAGEVNSQQVGEADINGSPLRTDARFRAASITKSLVATAVLQQVDRDTIELDAPIERYLPGKLPYGDAVTVRQLLNQTSGLPAKAIERALAPNSIDNRWEWRREMAAEFNSEDYLEAAATVKLANQPGKKFEYSNINFTLAALVLESVTGEPFADTIRSEIFRPLRMTRSAFPEGSTMRPPLARGYLSAADIGEPATNDPIDVSKQSSWWFYGSGDLITTTEDVTAFLDGLLTGRLISSELLDEMTQPSPQSKAAAASGQYRFTYGLGLMMVDIGCGIAVGHSGNYLGYYSLALSLDGSTVATAATADGSSGRLPISSEYGEFMSAVNRNVGSRLCPGSPPSAKLVDTWPAVDLPTESLRRN